ncbi:alpha/beta fold hydrolase [uncultured Chloroflexus sp.]|uniref:alpha/beta fold hydrolase n=1 Tax=uncultured Chloroflexus sp. TaxID=214040 RepID=UPI002627CF81|nr:alpha/beta fold hydrolase [uncultured Chloroflexus sp.]
MDAHCAIDWSPIRHLFPFAIGEYALPAGVLRYVDEGAGTPVVMLHGNPTWSFFYRRLITVLRGQRRVIALDHLGCGLSDKPQQYHYCLANHIANLEQLLAYLKLGPIDLVVHDWGGAIGMGWAVRHPELVRRIVILNTAAFLSPHIPLRIAAGKTPKIGEWAIRQLNAFALAATVMAVARPLPPEVRAGYLWPYQTPADRIAIARFVQDIPLHPAHPTWPMVDAIDRDLVRLRHKPVRILWGGRDWCFDDRFLAGWLARFPHAEVTRLDDVGHYVLEDASAEMIARLANWLLEKPYER